ncbi:MAG: SCP2 sterol-binding domain-containing protein [Calditrichia bacterium]
MTIDELKDQVSKKAASIEPLGTTIKMVLDGNVIFIDGGGEANIVSAEDNAANCTITTDMATLGEMMGGDLNPISAVMGGRVNIDGDMSAAMKLQEIFS